MKAYKHCEFEKWAKKQKLSDEVLITAFFIYGFAKNQHDNITALELKQMKMYAKLLLSFNKVQLKKLLEQGEFTEVSHEW